MIRAWTYSGTRSYPEELGQLKYWRLLITAFGYLARQRLTFGTTDSILPEPGDGLQE